MLSRLATLISPLAISADSMTEERYSRERHQLFSAVVLLDRISSIMADDCTPGGATPQAYQSLWWNAALLPVEQIENTQSDIWAVCVGGADYLMRISGWSKRNPNHENTHQWDTEGDALAYNFDIWWHNIPLELKSLEGDNISCRILLNCIRARYLPMMPI